MFMSVMRDLEHRVEASTPSVFEVGQVVSSFLEDGENVMDLIDPVSGVIGGCATWEFMENPFFYDSKWDLLDAAEKLIRDVPSVIIVQTPKAPYPYYSVLPACKASFDFLQNKLESEKPSSFSGTLTNE